jgi:hypothetical protein
MNTVSLSGSIIVVVSELIRGDLPDGDFPGRLPPPSENTTRTFEEPDGSSHVSSQMRFDTTRTFEEPDGSSHVSSLIRFDTTRTFEEPDGSSHVSSLIRFDSPKTPPGALLKRSP